MAACFLCSSVVSSVHMLILAVAFGIFPFLLLEFGGWDMVWVKAGETLERNFLFLFLFFLSFVAVCVARS